MYTTASDPFRCLVSKTHKNHTIQSIDSTEFNDSKHAFAFAFSCTYQACGLHGFYMRCVVKTSTCAVLYVSVWVYVRMSGWQMFYLMEITAVDTSVPMFGQCKQTCLCVYWITMFVANAFVLTLVSMLYIFLSSSQQLIKYYLQTFFFSTEKKIDLIGYIWLIS